MAFWHLDGLSDEQLLLGVRQLVRDKGRADARLVAHLVEVGERRLHLAAACSSLFAYCRRRLGLSENEAFHRMTAARLARRFPVIFDLLETRAVTLSALCLLRDYLTAENHSELLAAVSHKSQREVEALLAERFPAARARASLRKLPSKKLVPLCAPPPKVVMSGSAPSVSAREEAMGPSASVSVSLELSEGLVQPPAFALAPNSTNTAPAPHTASVEAPAPARVGSRASAAPPPVTSAPPIAFVPQPVASEPYFRLKLDVSARLKAKLEAATALMSHSNPRGEFELAVERGLDLLIAQLEKERWAKTARPRVPRAAGRSASTQAAAKGSRQPPSSARSTGEMSNAARPVELSSSGQPDEAETSRAPVSAAPKPRIRARIQSQVRRTIVERDGACCAFVSPDGQRCGERAFLQLHHVQPWAHGGADSSENLQLLCAAPDGSPLIGNERGKKCLFG